MAAENNLTPEKQLLKLIEKPMAQGSLHTATIRYQGLSLFSFGALKGRFAFFSNKFKNNFSAEGLRQMDIKALNMALEFFIAVLALYFIINLAVSVMHLRGDLKLQVRPVIAQEGKQAQITSLLKTASYYLEKARERDIFTIGSSKLPAMTGPSKGPSQRLIEATQDLRLVGISWSSDPDVMIENSKTQKTYFLKKGQVIESDVRVEAVFKDKVILSYGGEEIQLR